MITQIVFYRGGDMNIIKINGNDLLFSDSGTGWFPIEGLRLSADGVMKENPDLADNPNWRGEAIRRFKEKFKDIPDAEKVAYVIEEMKKFGWSAKTIKKDGFREEAVK